MEKTRRAEEESTGNSFVNYLFFELIFWSMIIRCLFSWWIAARAESVRWCNRTTHSFPSHLPVRLGKQENRSGSSSRQRELPTQRSAKRLYALSSSIYVYVHVNRISNRRKSRYLSSAPIRSICCNLFSRKQINIEYEMYLYCLLFSADRSEEEYHQNKRLDLLPHNSCRASH